MLKIAVKTASYLAILLPTLWLLWAWQRGGANHAGGAFAAGGGRIFDAAKCIGDAVGEHLFAALRC